MLTIASGRFGSIDFIFMQNTPESNDRAADGNPGPVFHL